VKIGALSVVMFLLFLIEGTIAQVFASEVWGLPWLIVPRFVLVGIVFIGLYAGRRRALLFGLFFGLLYDVVYAEVIGVYAFATATLGYLAGLASRYFHQSWLLVLVNVLLVTFINEWLVYEIYHLFNMANMNGSQLLFDEAIPTVVFNVLFALVIFRPMSKLLHKSLNKSRIDKEIV
jgi:rod shape-determining protein MreD